MRLHAFHQACYHVPIWFKVLLFWSSLFWRRRNFDHHRCARQPMNVVECTCDFWPRVAMVTRTMACASRRFALLCWLNKSCTESVQCYKRGRQHWIAAEACMIEQKPTALKMLQWSSVARCWCSLSCYVATIFIADDLDVVYHWQTCCIADISTCTTLQAQTALLAGPAGNFCCSAMPTRSFLCTQQWAIPIARCNTRSRSCTMLGLD